MSILWGVWREDQDSNGDSTQTGYVDSVSETLSTSVDNEWGKRPSLALMNKPWVTSGAYNTVSSISTNLTNIRNRGQIPVLGWRTEAWGSGIGSLPSLSLSNIASGAHDSGFLIPFAQALAALNYPICILLDEESNGSWNANWYDSTGVNFVAMWQHVVNVFRNNGATNVSWVWCINGIAPGGSFSNWWPGSNYVDWAGIDVFNTSVASGSPWIAFDQIVHGDGSQWGDSWDALLALDTTGKVRYGLTSFSSEDRTQTGANNFAQAASWLIDALGTQIPHAAGAARDYSKIEFILYFDQNEGASNPSDKVAHYNVTGYPLGTDTNRASAAKGPSGIGSAYYLKGGQFALPTGMGRVQPYGLTTPADPLTDAIKSTSGLTGFWWLNDTAGPMADQSGLARTLAVNGSPSFNQPGIVPSNGRGAVSYPGSTATYLDGGNLADWSILTTNQLSGGCAFNVPSLPAAGAFYCLMGKNAPDSAHYEWALRINHAGNIQFDAWSSGGGGHSSVSAGVITPGQNYFAVFTMNAARNGSGATPTDPQAHVYLISPTSTSAATAASNDDLTQALATATGTLQFGRRGDVSQAVPAGTKQSYGFMTNTELTAVTVQQYLRAFQTVVISNIAINTTPTSATISWTTDQASDSIVNYGLSSTYDHQTLPNLNQVTTHSVTINGLTDLTQYHFQVMSRNAAGAIGFSGDFTFYAGLHPWSVTTTGKLSIELSYYLPSTPTTQMSLISKASFSGGGVYEWQFYINATQIGFSLNQPNGATYASNVNALPAVGGWHHVVVTCDISQARPVNMWIDGAQQPQGSTTSGSPANGLAPVMIGQKADSGSQQPLMAGAREAMVQIYSTALSQETVAAHYSTWH